jgi:2-polyprenyl-6-methoxyphenol hydroxylase-like FAD-dependent oxidoreductase
MARILIAGCGDVGTTLGLSLHAAGHRGLGSETPP